MPPTGTPTPARNRAVQKSSPPTPTRRPSPKRQAASAVAFEVGPWCSPRGRRRSDSEETLRLGQPCSDPYMMGDDDKARHRWSLVATCNPGSGFCQVHVPCHVSCHVHVPDVTSSLVACHVSCHVCVSWRRITHWHVSRGAPPGCFVAESPVSCMAIGTSTPCLSSLRATSLTGRRCRSPLAHRQH